MKVADVLRLPGLGIVVEVARRYGRNGDGYLAASITYFAFVAAVPLALLVMSAAGFALERMGAERQAGLVTRLAAEIPALGPLVRDNVDAIVRFRTITGLVAVGGILWAASGAVNAIRHALGRIFDFDPGGGIIGPRLKGLAYLAVVFAAVLATTAATGYATSTGRVVIAAPTLLGVIAVNTGVSFLTYRLFVPSDRARTTYLAAGALLPGLVLSLLGLFGNWYARRVVARASLVYGTFAGIIGILVLLNLAAGSLLLGAELAAVLRHRSGHRR